MLDISQNCFSGVFGGIFSTLQWLRYMSRIYASECCLKKVFRGLTSDYVDLHRNEITSVDLHGLYATSLNLSYNQIQNISFEERQVSKLDLSYNNITDLNESDFRGRNGRDGLYQLILKFPFGNL